MKNYLSYGALLLAAFCAARADTVYSNEAAWASAVPGATVVNYAGLVSATGDLIYGTGVGSTTTLQSITYTAVSPSNSGDYLGILGPNLAGVNFGVPTLAVGGIPAGPAALLITLSQPVNALGFFFDTDDTPDVTITLSDGTTQTQSAVYPTFGFFGVTSSSGLTSVEISNALYAHLSPENAVFLSEFAYGPAIASATPEPSMPVLLVFGLALLGLRWRSECNRSRTSTPKGWW